MNRFSTNLILLSSLLLIAVTFQFSGCTSKDEQPAGPQITGITPDSGPAGSIVSIAGKGFNIDASKNIVKFNGVAATVQVATETLLAVVAPSGGTTGTVTVTIGTTEIKGPVFTYTEPQPTATYYIRFKANNEVKLYQTTNPGFSACGDCSCSSVPPLDDQNHASIQICQQSSVTAAMIQALKSKTLSFDSGSQVAEFFMVKDNVGYGSAAATQVTSSKMIITDVVADGALVTKKAFKVTGTFSCKIANSNGSVLNVTEGTFVIRFTEDF